MKWKISNICIWAGTIGTVISWMWLMEDFDPELSSLEALLCALLPTLAIIGVILAIKQLIWRYENGVDLFATLETDKVKLKNHMLFIMQYHGIEENFKELNDIFRNYPQWHLTDWEVFRAWYKEQIDHMVECPEIYHLTINGDQPYSKEEDPLYDPNAPDWALFDREHHDYDDDDDDDDDFDDYDDIHRKSDASDAFAFGIGVGLVNGLTGGSVFGGGNSSSGS